MEVDARVVPVVGRHVLEVTSDPVEAQRTRGIGVAQSHGDRGGEASTLIGERHEFGHRLTTRYPAIEIALNEEPLQVSTPPR